MTDKVVKISQEYHNRLAKIKDIGRFGSLKNTIEVLVDHWFDCVFLGPDKPDKSDGG